MSTSTYSSVRTGERKSGWLLPLVGVLFVLAALPLIWGGVTLISLGGSWYYLLAGLGVALSGVLIALRRSAGVWLYAIVYLATIAWALWESGLEFWPLVPRLVAPTVLAIVAALIAPLFPAPTRRSRALPFATAGVLALGLVATAVLVFQPHDVTRASFQAAEGAAPSPVTTASGNDWAAYGRTPAGTRYAPFGEITPENAGDLEVAWTFRTGTPPAKGAQDQNTPLLVGNTLYTCSSTNIVNALDATTGEKKWTYDPQAKSPLWQRCRGVSYYEASASPAAAAAADAAPAPGAPMATMPLGPTDGSAATAQAPAQPAAPAAPVAAVCPTRIVMTTIDARLIEIDAETGEPCADFGTNGIVDLRQGMGEVKDGFYFQTSAPTVMRDLVLVGGWVWDSVETGEPSGAVRAFSVRTGELVWAWDLGNPAITKEPPPGESYTRGTPNVWSTPAYDDALGLVYLPTGNATPDFWGGHRSQAAEEYSASIVALDIATGRERWKFQTTHHDIWDYDVPAQPALYDVPDGKGATVPALIQVTKRGQIFMLNRTNGEPIAEVQEKPVPQGTEEGDFTAPTQPYSVGMPAIGTEPFTEARMWGATPYDQLYCRIAFKKMRYDGEFTPPRLDRSLIYPGYYGGMNWGSASVDEGRGLLIVNDIRMPQFVQLIPRENVATYGPSGVHDGLSKQLGTPYGVIKAGFMSPLGVPCHQPPYGTISAIDLASRTLVWQIPAGTLQDTGPTNPVSGSVIKTGLQIPIGMPSLGGPMTTAGGVTFYAGTQDYYLRAIDTTTGEELWKGRLPVGAQATPMSYVGADGRQYVVISAGGARQSPDVGDYIVAYALPKR